MIGFVSALSLLVSGAPCEAALPRGPSVPAPIVLSTDCGWFRLATDGAVRRLPADWYATHTRPAPPHYTIGRTRPGRYLVFRQRSVVWRSAGLYFNEAGNSVFGQHAFAFDSWRKRGVFLTDLRRPERLVVPGRFFYPIGFSERNLFVGGRRTILVVSPAGSVVRRFAYRRSTGYAFDEHTKTLYFVSPFGTLIAARGSGVRRIVRTRERGWIGLLGRRLLTFTTGRHLAILRRSDGSLVASASWRGARRELDGGVAVSDDGRLFSFRVARRPQPGPATVYVLRSGEHRARAVYHHGFGQQGCGYNLTLDWEGSSLLYGSNDGSGVPEVAVLAPNGSTTRLTPLLKALPRKVRTTPGNAFWEADVTS
jgi:hypothetical protein